MKKKLGAMVMASAILSMSITGCGGDETAKRSNAGETIVSEPEEGGQGEINKSGLSADVETLKVYMPLVGAGNTTDLEKVEAAINDYIEPLIHANMDLSYIPYAQWEDQMNMVVASGEQVDLMCTVREISGYYKNGALQPLDELLDSYGQGIGEYVQDIYLDSCTFGGEIYGVPTIRDMAKQQVFEYSVEVANKYGLEMKDQMSFDELEEQFMKMKEQAPEIPCLLMRNSVRSFDSWCGWDAIGDNYGVVMMDQSDVQLVNLFESEEYAELLYRMEKWYKAGIINQEAPTADIQWADIVPTGNILGRFARSKPGYEQQETVKYGVELKTVTLMDPIVDSAQAQFMAWAIPTTAKYPEKAMALMNLFYTDATVVNLMSYGIEGDHYVIIDEEQGIIDYPEGIDSSNSFFNPGMNFGVGNELLGFIWQGNEPDIWEQLAEFNNTAKASPALGFAFDNSKVANEITACNNVLAKYAIGLEIGCLDVKTILPEFQQALRDAGIENIIAEKQSQINEWYQNNNQ